MKTFMFIIHVVFLKTMLVSIKFNVCNLKSLKCCFL